MVPGGSPRCSIVIPFFGTHNSQVALLDETLATADAQGSSDYEVIVIDDGSPVDVSQVATRHRGTRVYRQSNGGSALARNAGIAYGRGECFLFLDGDDHLLPDALSTFFAVLDAHPEAGFVVGPREEMTFGGEPVPWPVLPPPAQTDLYLPLLAFDWYIIPPSCAMFRRWVVDRVGGFQNPWGADDLDFYLRAARVSAACCFQAPAVTRYRRYSASSSRDGVRMLGSVRTVYEREWPIVERDAAARAAWKKGLRELTDIFLDCVVENVLDRLRTGDRAAATPYVRFLAEHSPARLGAIADGDRDGSAPERRT
jgi:glycosyltransferase involved in cell wall biosynthesis